MKKKRKKICTKKETCIKLSFRTREREKTTNVNIID